MDSMSISIKRIFDIRIAVSVILFVIMLLSGYSIIIEGYHLLVAKQASTIDELSISPSRTHKYTYVIADDISYTDIDIVFENTIRDKKFKGYMAKMDDKYILVFRQDNVDEASRMILLPSYFSEGNNELFKATVYQQIIQSQGLSFTQVQAMFHPEVFVDVRGRIKEDIPIVIAWVMFIILLAIVCGWNFREKKRWKDRKDKYRYIPKQAPIKLTSNTYISDRAVFVLSYGLKVFPFETIRQYRIDPEMITLYFHSNKMIIRADKQMITKIKHQLFPEILIYEDQ